MTSRNSKFRSEFRRRPQFTREEDSDDAKLKQLNDDDAVDSSALEKQWRAHDVKTAATKDGDYATQPQGDCFAMSQNMFNKYAPAAKKGSQLI